MQETLHKYDVLILPSLLVLPLCRVLVARSILTLEVLGSRGEPQAQLEVLQGGSPGATRRDGGRAPVGSEFSTGLCWALNARPRCHHAQEPHRRGGALSVITPRSLTAHASGGHAV